MDHGNLAPPPQVLTPLSSTPSLTLPVAGFVRRVQGINTANGWDHVYDLSYFFGFLVSMVVHVILHKTFPAKKQTGASPFQMELHRSRRVDGTRPQGYVESTTSHEDETVVMGKEKDGSGKVERRVSR